MGDHDAALVSLSRALAIREGSTADPPARLAATLELIGHSHVARGAPAEALPHYERAVAILQEDPAPQSASARERTRFALAQAAWDVGDDRPRARALAERTRDALTTLADVAALAEVNAWLADHRVSAP
jgi:tetratricopeptide (TPR) repeat protein